MKLEFAYDYMGRRIFKKVYSGEILETHLSFVYDGYKLIEERNALDNNAAVRKYVWQPEVLDRDVPLTIYDTASEKTYYYHTDANKNVTELSDESGEVIAHYEYSPFGSLTKVTGDYAANNPFRFSSEYFDEETGLVYYNYRYYDPELGRWISRDPIEEQGGYNLYGMIGNNPLYGWDAWGCELCNRCKKGNLDEYIDFVKRQKEEQAKIIQDAVSKALNMEKNEFELIDDGNFVKVKDPSKLPQDGWDERFSTHSNNAKERDISGSEMKVKYYPDDNQKITITKPTNSLGHYIDGVRFHLELPVNVSNAKQALKDMNGGGGK